MSSFLQRLPKAELHLHLEGTVEPATLVELSKRHDAVPLTIGQVEEIYRYTDFLGFLMAFKAVTERLTTPEDFEYITYELMRTLKQQNVLHAEVYVSVGVVQWRGEQFEPLFEGMERGRERGQHDFGVSLLWIFDAVRHFGTDAAKLVFDLAAEYRDRNVVGIGIGGDEKRAGAEMYKDLYAEAKSRGLRLTAHAGESVGAESIWAALNIGAERIGHGLTAHHDRELIEVLAQRQIPIEICFSSNLRTACCPHPHSHPVRRYFEEGLMVTINSDDPAMFQTTLLNEYIRVQQHFEFSDEQMLELARNSFEASFLPYEKKAEYLQMFDAVAAQTR
ncbi:MAG TPA: adenosine deaminase [Terriglobales bacterium]|jgi:adenosine deaminase/aminodeoxyfutalosine deaminase